MATEYRLNYSAEQVEKRLDNAGNAILCTEQTLTPEQKEQTRKNIAAVGCLIGSSTEIAPSQVRQAILSGENVTISYIDDTFGTFFFSDFIYSEAANCLLCSAIVDSGESLLSATIYGNLGMEAWILSTDEISLKSDIPSAVNEALAQAKANGEFDGKDGTSVTVKSVSESTADGGSNVITFSDGKTVTIKNGSKGSTGAAGKTPVRGTDYYTEADQAEFSNYIATELAKRGQLKPEFAQTIAECTDTTKLYVLPDGYIYAYMPSNGPAYTNVLDEVGYSENVRISTSSGYSEQTADGYDLTGYVRLKVGDVVRMRNITIPNTTSGYDSTFYAFDVNKNGLGKGNVGYLETNGANPVWENGNLTQLTVVSWMFGNGVTEGYIRFGAGNVDDTSILTVNEEITEGAGGGYTWQSTGHAFVPADYEDRIVELERKATDFEERISAVEGLPDYAIAERDRIRDELYEKLTLGNVAIIGFSTDQHISKWADMEATCNTQGTLAGLRALKSLTHKFPFNAVVLGGDYVTGGSVQSIQTETAMVFEQLAGALCPVVGTTGNHDSWQNDSTITDGDIFKSHTANAVMNYHRFANLNAISANGYIDDPTASLRYIILDAEPRADGSTNSTSTITANLTAMLNGMPSGYKAVIFSHKPLNNSLGNSFKDAVDNKSVLESNKSKIVCCINGHGHLDASATSNGVLYIQTTCAGIDRPNDTYDRTVGTANETVFDVFVIDQTNRKIYAVRYGAGEDREFTIPS